MTIKDWKKLKSHKSQPNTEMWGNEKKGGMVFISKLQYSKGTNQWRFGGTNQRGYFKETYTQTKSQAIKYAKDYMRSH